jgi:hypothetical protein
VHWIDDAREPGAEHQEQVSLTLGLTTTKKETNNLLSRVMDRAMITIVERTEWLSMMIAMHFTLR